MTATIRYPCPLSLQTILIQGKQDPYRAIESALREIERNQPKGSLIFTADIWHWYLAFKRPCHIVLTISPACARF